LCIIIGLLALQAQDIYDYSKALFQRAQWRNGVHIREMRVVVYNELALAFKEAVANKT